MTDALSRLDALGGPWLDWTRGMFASTAILLVVAVTVDLLLRHRVSAGWRQLPYAVVFLRLLVPVAWATPLGLLGATGSALPAAAPAQIAVQAGTAPSEPPAPVSVAERAPGLSVAGWGLLAHAAGALAVLAWSVGGRLRLSRELRGAAPADLDGDGVPVVIHDRLGPAVAGILRPLIVLPRRLIERLPSEALDAVLRHERAHVRRGDPLTSVAVQVALILAWPVAPLWVAAGRLRRLMEEACDERAVRGEGGAGRRLYGETLLAVAAWSPARQRAALGLLPFGDALRGRLRALGRRRRWPALAQASLVLLACAGSFAAAGTRSNPAVEATTTDPVRGGGVPVSLTLTDVTLRDAVLEIARVAGCDVAAPPAGGERLSLRLEEVSARKALELVARTRGMEVVEDGEVLRLEPGGTEPVRVVGLVAPAAVVLRIEGDVRVVEPEGLASRPARVGDALPAGSRLLVADGRARVRLEGPAGRATQVEGPGSVVLGLPSRVEPGPVGKADSLLRADVVHVLPNDDGLGLHLLARDGAEGPPAAGAAPELRFGPLPGIADEEPLEPGRVEPRGGSEAEPEEARRDDGAWVEPDETEPAPASRAPAGAVRETDVGAGVPPGAVQRLRAIAGADASVRSVHRRGDELVLEIAAPTKEEYARFARGLAAEPRVSDLRLGIVRDTLSGLDVRARLRWAEDRGAVLVEVRILELTPDAAESLGLPAAPGPVLLGEDVSTFELDQAIGGLERRGRVRVISMPRIMVQVGESAEIESGVQVPVVTTTADEIDVSFVKASLRIPLVTRLEPDGSVVVDWAAETLDPEARLQGSVPAGRTAASWMPAVSGLGRVAAWVTVNEPE